MVHQEEEDCLQPLVEHPEVFHLVAKCSTHGKVNDKNKRERERVSLQCELHRIINSQF